MQEESQHKVVQGQPEADSLWTVVKGAFLGTEADLTKVTMNRAIILLAIPMILELIMESVFAVVDIYFVNQLGASAVATVGLTETYLFLLYSVAMGLAVAITAIISRRVGEKDGDAAGRSAVQSIFLALLASLPVALCGIFFPKQLLSLMGGDAWVVNEGYGYTQWMLGTNSVIILLFTINAIFRGAGDAAIAMRVLWLANGLNIILDPILIFGLGPIPAFGIEGAAYATSLGRGAGVLYQIWVLVHGAKKIKVMTHHWIADGRLMLHIVKTSLGGIGQMLIAMTSWIFIMRILADIGSEAVAGATTALRLMMFTLMPAWGLSNAAATLVGQNLGAHHPDRAEASVWKTGWYNMVFLVIVSFIYYFFNDGLMRIFSDDERVIAIGAEWIRIMSYCYVIYGWWMVSVQAFNGAGDTRTPTWINFIFFWLIQIPLAWWLASHLGWQESGVFWAIFFSEGGVGLFTLWLFSRGQWKTYQV